MHPFLKKSLPHVAAILFFLGLSYVLFSPQLQGMQLQQSDNQQFQGMSKELNDYRDRTGEEALWTNSMFGGMPSYLISTVYKTNYIRYVDGFLQLGHSRPASFLFIMLLGSYILMLALGMNPWLGVIGSLALSLSSYYFIIIAVGHNSKMIAIAYLVPLIGSIILAYRKKLWLGVALAGLFLGLELYAGHPQITYYGAFVIFFFILAEAIRSYREKIMKHFVKVSAALGIALVLGIGANFSHLYLVWDYGKDSIRGKSELTHNAENKTSGLDKDYALSWSYGIAETFDLFIPNLMGGSSTIGLKPDGETAKTLTAMGQPAEIATQIPSYWGSQPSTSGPVYIGAVVIFFFVLGLFLVGGVTRWWLVSVTVLSILLAWGSNFLAFSEFFLKYVPMYNKFRTVSMILVIAEITIPIVALLGLKKMVNGEAEKEQAMKGLKWALGIAGGVALFFVLMGGSLFSFISDNDRQMLPQEALNMLASAMSADRAALLSADAWRTLIFVALSAGLAWLFIAKKIKPVYFMLALGGLILVDMVPVNHRYLNKDNWVPEMQAQVPFAPSPADLQIMKDPGNYRVLNLTVSPFNDASTSYFHKSIGGYHGAKMRRYQELIDFHLSQNNMAAFNMLNTKYIIVPNQQTQAPEAQQNPGALGNAWFVNSVKLVPNADVEIEALKGFEPRRMAIVDKRFEKELNGFISNADTTARIELTKYEPNHLTYKSDNKSAQLAVFSEIYYSKGWNAYVNGKPASHLRANYVLRAMVVPAGENTIEFKFEPKMFKVGKTVDLFCSLSILLLAFGLIGYELSKIFRAQKLDSKTNG
ncbi:YfhO family protein [Acetobacteroides hydrogenigenes]|uniref:Membrane protein YfhO n=1 Tax=Acetobacteroides hydrogenigenes TaxID=979970 RepID=A0A4V2RQZ6_9BACT|nr:YfhO family protein [Acetobacteroides hydrogenigenes]TCN73301.1 membrane protein YfhO [Acetobacteroides hydrogenigenes]